MCLLRVVCSCVACYVLFVVCRGCGMCCVFLLFVDCWLFVVVWWLLFVDVCCFVRVVVFWIDARWLLFAMCCLLRVVQCVLLVVC